VLTGTIPSELDNLLNLVYLNLDKNFLTGTIMTQMFQQLTNLGTFPIKSRLNPRRLTLSRHCRLVFGSR
jgi:hypothetical protein